MLTKPRSDKTIPLGEVQAGGFQAGGATILVDGDDGPDQQAVGADAAAAGGDNLPKR